MTRWIEADETAELLKPGMTVFVAAATAEPREVLEALARRAERCAGVRFVSVSLPGINGVDFCALHPEAKSTVFLATAENRGSVANGRADFVPLQYRAIYDYLEHDLAVDVAILQLPPAGDDGTVSLGVSTAFAPAVLAKAGLVIAEINTRQPAPSHAPKVPIERLDLAVACDRPVPSFPVAETGEEARTIGRHVASVVCDGDCIQIGIGAIPDATLMALADKNDLGIHTGMITDRVMALAKSGNITGRKKTIDRGKIVTGVTLGSQALVEWAGGAPDLAFRPVSHTHDAGVLRRLDNFVAINSALQVDLFGQVNAEMLDARQISGTGGSIDMARGAALSPGGRSIIALNATARRGKSSRIVAALPSHSVVTAPRTDVDYVATEYGIQRIRYLSVSARAEALIEIAAPQFRDRLRADWQALRTR